MIRSLACRSRLVFVSSPLCWNSQSCAHTRLNRVRGLRGTVHRQEVLVWNTHGGLRTESTLLRYTAHLSKVRRQIQGGGGGGGRRGGVSQGRHLKGLGGEERVSGKGVTWVGGGGVSARGVPWGGGRGRQAGASPGLGGGGVRQGRHLGWGEGGSGRGVTWVGGRGGQAGASPGSPDGNASGRHKKSPP